MVEEVRHAALAAGPGLRWALMGPHLTFHLAGGEGGMAHFLDHLGDANEAMWRQLGTPGLTPRTRTALIEGCAREAEGHTVGELRRRRDAQLVALLASSRRIT